MEISKSGDWICARAGAEVMMMSAAQGKYLGLNAMGARIWDLIDTARNREDLCVQLLQEFEVTEDMCCAEVDAFLAELVRHKAIEIAPARAA